MTREAAASRDRRLTASTWPRGPLLALLAVLAAVNLGLGVWRSLSPTHVVDLRRVAEWSTTWISGVNPYAPPDSEVDYPPWALVVLSPLSAVPERSRPVVWVIANLALLAWLARHLAAKPSASSRARAWLVVLLGATASARTLNQFSLLAFALALAGSEDRSPWVGGLGLGLALFKPQIGGVVWLWTLLRRQWRRAAVALTVPIVLTGVFAAHVHEGPLAVLRQYGHVLALIHGSIEPFEGHTELRAWLIGLWPNVAGRLGFAAGLGGLLLLPAAIGLLRRPLPWTIDRQLELLGLCGAVSLLSVRHLSYDFILFWPVIVAWRVPPFSENPTSVFRIAAFAGLAGLLVFGLPGWVRLVEAHVSFPGLDILLQADRLLALAVWAILSWRIVGGK